MSMGCRTLPAMLGYADEGAWWARAGDVGGAVELHRRCLGKSYNMGKRARRVGKSSTSAWG